MNPKEVRSASIRNRWFFLLYVHLSLKQVRSTSEIDGVSHLLRKAARKLDEVSIELLGRENVGTSQSICCAEASHEARSG